jgi:integrase/recombinase XerD
MGDVFKQRWTRKDGRSGVSRKWYGQYRDHTDILRRVPLSSDKTAARAMLAELIRKAEYRRAGLADDATDAASGPIAGLVADYLRDLKLRGRSPRYRAEVEQLLARILPDCGFTTPGELASGPLDAYLGSMDTSARTKSKHRQAAVGFASWLVRKGKLAANPLQRSTPPLGPSGSGGP